MSHARMHPLVPAIADSEMLFSSLPMITELSLGSRESPGVKLFSWNITGVSRKHLFNLKSSVERLGVDLILLQGIPSKEMFNYIRDNLGISVSLDIRKSLDISKNTPNYTSVDIRRSLDVPKHTNNVWSGLVDFSATTRDFPKQFIFYRKPALMLVSEEDLDAEWRTLSASFYIGRLNKKIHLHNVWSAPAVSLDKKAAYYRNLLTQKSNTTIIMGDLGAYVAPFVADRGHATMDEMQLSSVGGFCMGQGRCSQLHTEVVSVEGDIEKTGHLSAKAKSVCETLQEVLCLDSRYAEEVVIDGKKLVECEQTLRKKLGENNIFVSVVVNPVTETRLAERYVFIRFAADNGIETAVLLASLMQGKAQLVNQYNTKCVLIKYHEHGLDDAIDVLCKIKQAINNVNPNTFEEAIKLANKRYVESTHVVPWLLSFGFYSSLRDSRIKTRVDTVSAASPSLHAEILAILANPETGSDLKSFKHFLVSSLVGVVAADDTQAKAFIDYSVSQLQAYIKYADKFDENARSLTKSGSSDTQ